MPWSNGSRAVARTRGLQARSHSPGAVAPGLWLLDEGSKAGAVALGLGLWAEGWSWSPAVAPPAAGGIANIINHSVSYS